MQLTSHHPRNERDRLLRSHKYTNHALKRMAQRNIAKRDVRQAFLHGKKFYHGGLFHYVLDTECIPGGKDSIFFDDLEGVVVLTDLDTYEVVTVYRNPNAVPELVRKIKIWIENERGRSEGGGWDYGSRGLLHNGNQVRSNPQTWRNRGQHKRLSHYKFTGQNGGNDP